MNHTKVELLAIKKDYEHAPVFVGPYFDEANRKFRVGKKEYEARHQVHPKNGDEFISEGAPLVITDTSLFRIGHGDVFDKNVPQEVFRLQIAVDSGYVAKNFQSINALNHRYYIKDEQAEAKASAKKSDLVFEALTLVRKMTGTELSDFAYFMKQPARQWTGEMIEGYVKDLAMKTPKVVIENLTGREWKIRAFLQMCVQFGIVSCDGGGVYKIGPNVIGLDADAAVHFLKNKENYDLVQQLKDKLAGERGMKTSDEEESETKPPKK